ncbi:MAG: THUMP domain-containing class I SAM-dependent RNA methyltransferase [Bacillota bacterium]
MHELIATATFGLEAVVRREIEGLGYEIIRTEDGKVTFAGDERAIVRSNLWLRSADRVLLKVCEFEALEFEDLFQGIKGCPWEELIPVDGKFTVTCSTVKSKLHNPPAIQSVSKKAVVERMSEAYGVSHFKETGAEYTIKVTMLKDRATVTVDTSGTGLHKRGYRVAGVDAPMKETLAAALIQLSFFRAGRILVDPCCGSGTIPIEAAMIAANIAPGLNRKFASEDWELIPREIWKEERRAAFEAMEQPGQSEEGETEPPAGQTEPGRPGGPLIFAGDISTEAIEAARANAREAGVEDWIAFARGDVRDLARTGDRGIIVTNPPYGERIGIQDEIDRIFKALGRFCRENPDWSLFIITPDRDAEKEIMGRRADRRRKLYNGNIETTYYQFHGAKK